MFTMNEIVRVQSMEQAYELNQKRNNKVIGGMLWMKMQHNNIGTGIDLSDLGLGDIEETEDEFRIGCMCTLRKIETHQGLNGQFSNLMKESLRHLVGVQFRNSATVGGSIYGRFGFSDVLTSFLVLDSYVELYKSGRVAMKDFIAMPYDNDILVRVIIKKDHRSVYYESLRASATDFPILTCAVALKENEYFISVGARPVKAGLTTMKIDDLSPLDTERIAQISAKMADEFTYGTNMRGSREYRNEIAKVLIKRGISSVLEGVPNAD